MHSQETKNKQTNKHTSCKQSESICYRLLVSETLLYWKKCLCAQNPRITISIGKQKCLQLTLLKYKYTHKKPKTNKHTSCKRYKSIRYRQLTIGFGNLKKCLYWKSVCVPQILESKFQGKQKWHQLALVIISTLPRNQKQTNKQMHILQTI